MTNRRTRSILPLAIMLLTCSLPVSAAPTTGEGPKPMKDLDRPTYHFQPPPSWMNDPKPLFTKGEYHIFFQYNPNAPYHALIQWGHAVSRDLVHWKQLPNALVPTPGGPDKDGCWTGCAVEKDGIYHILYTGVHPQVQCLATSKDMITWEKRKEAVLTTPPEGFGDCWRDPCAWKEPDAWYMLIGSQRGELGAALLYKSNNLVKWEYLHPIYTGDKTDGVMFECPDLFPLEKKHVLITSCGATFWHIGQYKDHKFTLEKQGVTDGGNFYAAKTLVDDKRRRLLFGWITEGRPQEECNAAGWSGMLSLPRVLGIRKDGTLSTTPVPELKELRGKKHAATVKSDSVKMLEGVRGQALEIIARFKPGNAKQFGLILRSTADRKECTKVYVDPESKLLVAGGGEDASVRRVQTHFDPAGDKEITLHVFLDHSVIEVFAGDRACLTARSYTQNVEADCVGAFGDCTIEAWSMAEGNG